MATTTIAPELVLESSIKSIGEVSGLILSSPAAKRAHQSLSCSFSRIDVPRKSTTL
jgi:hypothetical protein